MRELVLSKRGLNITGFLFRSDKTAKVELLPLLGKKDAAELTRNLLKDVFSYHLNDVYPFCLFQSSTRNALEKKKKQLSD